MRYRMYDLIWTTDVLLGTVISLSKEESYSYLRANSIKIGFAALNE